MTRLYEKKFMEFLSPIKKETLEELAFQLDQVYPNKWRYCVDIFPHSMLATIDSEEVAMEATKQLKDERRREIMAYFRINEPVMIPVVVYDTTKKEYRTIGWINKIVKGQR